MEGAKLRRFSLWQGSSLECFSSPRHRLPNSRIPLLPMHASDCLFAQFNEETVKKTKELGTMGIGRAGQGLRPTV